MKDTEKKQEVKNLELSKYEPSHTHRLTKDSLEQSGIPKLYWETNLKNIRCQQSAEFVFNYIHRVDTNKENKGIVLYSDDQTASALACVIGKLFMLRHKKVKYYSFYDAVTTMFDQWKKNSDSMNDLFDLDLLILDSVGIKSTRNDMSLGFLELVLEKRIKMMNHTIIVSKLPLGMCDSISFEEVYKQCFRLTKDSFYLIETSV